MQGTKTLNDAGPGPRRRYCRSSPWSSVRHWPPHILREVRLHEGPQVKRDNGTGVVKETLDYLPGECEDRVIERPEKVGTVSMGDIEEVREALAAATRGPVTA